MAPITDTTPTGAVLTDFCLPEHAGLDESACHRMLLAPVEVVIQEMEVPV